MLRVFRVEGGTNLLFLKTAMFSMTNRVRENLQRKIVLPLTNEN